MIVYTTKPLAMTGSQALRLIFHKETIIFIASLVCLWFAIGLMVDSNYSLPELTKHSGQLVKMDSVVTSVKDKPLFKEVTRELRLTVDTEDDYFTTVTTKDFGGIVNKLAVGDSVEIFTKKKRWGIFGMKKENDISHLVKGDVVLIDFDAYRQSIEGLFILPLLLAIVTLCYYYVLTRRRYMRDIKRYR